MLDSQMGSQLSYATNPIDVNEGLTHTLRTTILLDLLIELRKEYSWLGTLFWSVPAEGENLLDRELRRPVRVRKNLMPFTPSLGPAFNLCLFLYYWVIDPSILHQGLKAKDGPVLKLGTGSRITPDNPARVSLIRPHGTAVINHPVAKVSTLPCCCTAPFCET